MIKTIFIVILATIVWDFFRLLMLKLLSKKLRFFAILPDTEQLRLSSVSKQLGVPSTKIVVNEDTYYDIDNPDKVYKITCTTNYLLQEVDENGQVIEKETQEVVTEDNSVINNEEVVESTEKSNETTEKE